MPPETPPSAPRLLDPREFLRDAAPFPRDDILRSVRGDCDGLINAGALRAAEDWAFLANQVVGAESPDA